MLSPDFQVNSAPVEARRPLNAFSMCGLFLVVLRVF